LQIKNCQSGKKSPESKIPAAFSHFCFIIFCCFFFLEKTEKKNQKNNTWRIKNRRLAKFIFFVRINFLGNNFSVRDFLFLEKMCYQQMLK